MKATRPGPGAVGQLTKPAVERSRLRLPMRTAGRHSLTAEAVSFRGLADGQEHLALVFGDALTWDVPLVRVHSECLTGDVFASTRCDCGPQLHEAVERISSAGGVLLYLRQEGRGIGLYNKLDAYPLQDAGLDTYDANAALGFPEDSRDYTAAAQMLATLGIHELDLLTNNPDKATQLRELGVVVRQTMPPGVFATGNNLRYLQAKVERAQHDIDLGLIRDDARMT